MHSFQSPSAGGTGSADAALARLLCPLCDGSLLPSRTGGTQCTRCREQHPCRKGVLGLRGQQEAAPRKRTYQLGGRELLFFDFFASLLRVQAYRDTTLEDELYTLLGWLDLEPGEPILLLGCGQGQLALTIARACPDSALVACDDALPELAAADALLTEQGIDSVTLVHCSLDQPPLRSDSFSAVLHFGLLHSLPDEQAHMHGLARIVRPGGHLVGISLAQSTLPHIAQAQANQEHPGLRFIAMEPLARAMMTKGWVRFRHQQASNWMASFVATRSAQPWEPRALSRT